MGKIIKQAIFFFTRISLPAVSSTTGARFQPYHHVQQEAGFRDRTSRRCCKLCRQSKHLHTYQWEKKRILLPAVLSQLAHVSALSLSATWGGGRVQWQNLAGCSLIHCGRRRRQDPMPEPDGRSAQREVLLLENSIWHDRNSRTSSAVEIPRLKGSHERSSANSVILSFRCGFTSKSFFVSLLINEVFLDTWIDT